MDVNRKYAIYALATVVSCTLLAHPASAKWGKLTVTDGAGDGLEMHQYPLGLGKGIQAQDQLGDSFGYKKGLFGINRTTEGSVLGNGLKIHHGLISGTSVDAQSMFGDTVKSHKFLKIGPRITTVNLSGVHGVASSLLNHSATPNFMPAANGYTSPALGANPGESVMHTPESMPSLPSGPAGSGPVDPSAYATPPGAP